MQTLSSARRTCMASASAVECTATVGMPSSWQARSTRSAISPRLAMRILSNIVRGCPRLSLDDDERLAELDRLAVLDQDLRHGTRAGRRYLIHGLHRLDDEERIADHDLAAEIDEGRCTWLGPPIGGADHRRGDGAGVLGGVGGCDGGGSGGWWRRRGRAVRGDVGHAAAAAADADAKTGTLDLDFGQPGF